MTRRVWCVVSGAQPIASKPRVAPCKAPPGRHPAPALSCTETAVRNRIGETAPAGWRLPTALSPRQLGRISPGSPTIWRWAAWRHDGLSYDPGRKEPDDAGALDLKAFSRFMIGAPVFLDFAQWRRGRCSATVVRRHRGVTASLFGREIVKNGVAADNTKERPNSDARVSPKTQT